jgi:predicted nucleic acid-binding Zn ribbon protein
VSPPGDRAAGPPGDERGPDRVDSVIRDVFGEPGMRRGILLGRLVRSWEQVMGPRLALETAPWAFEGGELVVAASSPAWAAQVRFLASEVRHNANRELAGERVRSVRVIVRPESLKPSKPLRRNRSDVSPGDDNLRSEGPSR